LSECLKLIGGRFQICVGDIIEYSISRRTIVGRVKAVDNSTRMLVVENDGHEHLISVHNKAIIKVLERSQGDHK